MVIRVVKVLGDSQCPFEKQDVFIYTHMYMAVSRESNLGAVRLKEQMTLNWLVTKVKLIAKL